MKPQSNIFVYIELNKLVENLTLNPLWCKARLKSQASRFVIIPLRYFSDKLSGEWSEITHILNIAETDRDKKVRYAGNTAQECIEQMSDQMCQALTRKVCDLFEKVKLEFI